MSNTTKASAGYFFVMAGLGPAINGPDTAAPEGMDARDKHGHDVFEFSATAGQQGRIAP
jgi:hypothetical protein